jgi:hypothetical protein
MLVDILIKKNASDKKIEKILEDIKEILGSDISNRFNNCS